MAETSTLLNCADTPVRYALLHFLNFGDNLSKMVRTSCLKTNLTNETSILPAMNMIKAAKSTFRKEMKQKLGLMSQEDKISQSENVCKKLLTLPEYQKSQRISIFLSMADEIQTETILKDAFSSNKTCFIPRYDSKSTFMDMVRLYSWSEFESLPMTKWKIKQPPLDEERETALASGGLDLILIPGLAFTTQGKRMGRGRGYYDTYLTRCIQQQAKPPITVALAYKQQVVADLPTEETDVLIDVILSSTI